MIRRRLLSLSVRCCNRSCSENHRGKKKIPSMSVQLMRFMSSQQPKQRVPVPSQPNRNLSSVAVAQEEWHHNDIVGKEINVNDSENDATAEASMDDPDELQSHDSRHCSTCTCEDDSAVNEEEEAFCGQAPFDQEMPPPLPEPTYSVYKRVLPGDLTALSSPLGRRYLMESLQSNMAESYWALSEHFCNQSDPAYCGVTTLMMVLNAMSVDPQVRWRGGWRYYGSEDVLLSRCCLEKERIRRAGISMTEFALLAKCQGVQVDLRRPNNVSLDQFRKDIVEIVQGPTDEDEASPEKDVERRGILVVSFARSALGQTGEGHFSPVAAYHKQSDSILLLDVARFKYAPYWVSVENMYNAMKPLDEATQNTRGWFLMRPPPQISSQSTSGILDEQRRPAEIVPEAGQGDICPVGKIKVEFCSAKHHKQTRNEP